MVTWRDRIAASFSAIAGATLALSAKSAALMLCLWPLVFFCCASDRKQLYQIALNSTVKPSPPLVALIAFSVFTALSIFWARDPIHVLAAASALAAVLLATVSARACFSALPNPAALLVGGWFIIGLLFGCCLLLHEIMSGFRLLRWFAFHFPYIAPSKNSMFVLRNGDWLVLNRSFGNWSVAGINLLLWPLLLIASAVSRNRRLYGGAIYLLFLYLTFKSEHQTSQVAIVASALVFGAATIAPTLARHCFLGAFVAIVIGVVPLSIFVGQQFEENKVGWAQRTLQDRFRIWGNASVNYTYAPILGIGANNTTTAETEQKRGEPSSVKTPSPYHAHNVFLQIWLELGVVGAALLLAIGILGYRSLTENREQELPFILAALSTATIEAYATWSPWSIWFLGMFGVMFFLLLAGIRLSQEARAPGSVRFSQIWLPPNQARVDA